MPQIQLVLLLMGAFTLPTAAAACDEVANMLLLHGDVLTVDKSDSIAEAIAIRRNRIVAVGSDQELVVPRGGVEQFKNFNGLRLPTLRKPSTELQ